jgi:hypothetical protein
MSERIASVLMLLTAIYGGAWFALTEPESDMLWLFLGLAIASVWTVHAVWTAEVFSEEQDGE